MTHRRRPRPERDATRPTPSPPTAAAPLANPRVALAPTGDGYLAYDIDARRLHRLNTAAALILELCDGSRPASEVDAMLATTLGDGNSSAWIDSARRDGLIGVRRGSTTVSPVQPAELASLSWELRNTGHVLAAYVCRYHATLADDQDAAHWLELGELAHIIGKRERSRAAYERYLELQPGNAEVEHLLVALRDEAAPSRAPDRAIRQLYARFADYYEDNMRGELDYCVPELIVESLDPALDGRDGLDVLDLGCGTGLVGSAIAPRAATLVGIDLSPEMAERATATAVYDRVDVAEITAWLGQATGPQYDLIIAGDTLIYFGDLHQVLVPAARNIRPGGLLAFTVEHGHDADFSLTDSGRYTHSPTHLAAVATAAGLTVLATREAVLRQEYGEPVNGLVAVMQRV